MVCSDSGSKLRSVTKECKELHIVDIRRNDLWHHILHSGIWLTWSLQGREGITRGTGRLRYHD